MKSIVLDIQPTIDHILIIDFYNVYCSLIQFNKYKKFSAYTFDKCIRDFLMKNLTIYKKIIIVSKIIFEIDDNHVNQLTKEFPILTYIIVDDLVVSKIN